MIYLFKVFIKKIYTILSIKKITKKYPKWEFLKKKKIENGTKGIKSILIAPCVGSNRISITIESLIGYSLNFKNNNVEFLLCDEALPACTQSAYVHFKNFNEFIKYGPIKLCAHCWHSGKNLIDKTKFFINRFSNNLKDINKVEIDDIIKKTKYEFIKHFKLNGISIGEHAFSGALRFLTKSTINYNSEEEKKILIRYFKSALISYFVAQNLFEKKNFDILLINHGFYTPQGVIFEVAKKKNVQVICWFLSDLKKTIILNHDEPFHKSENNKQNDDWKKLNLNKKKNKKIDEYLTSRRTGKNDWKFFQNQKKITKTDNFFHKNNILESNDFAVLFTNVAWDAQISYKDGIFENMNRWICATIDYFIKINKRLIIRIHPAEVTGGLPTKYKLKDYLTQEYRNLPKNIIIIDSNENINSYQLIDKCKFGIVYSSTIANEIMVLNKPVIIAGDALIKNKNISYDPKTIKEYFHLINIFIKDSHLDGTRLLLARKFFFYYYFKKMIPIKILSQDDKLNSNMIIKTEDMKRIFMKQDKGLEMISKSILEKKDFIYEPEDTESI